MTSEDKEKFKNKSTFILVYSLYKGCLSNVVYHTKKGFFSIYVFVTADMQCFQTIEVSQGEDIFQF